MWSRKLSQSEARDMIEERDRVLVEMARQMELDLNRVEYKWPSLVAATKNIAGEQARLLRDALERSGLVRVSISAESLTSCM
jgi:hypothetical protein